MKTSPKTLFSLGLCTLFAVAHTHAQVTLDDDNASDIVYDNGIQEFDNGSTTGGGTGFGGWVFGANTVGNFDIASGGSNGGTGSIDVTGESFRLSDVGASGSFIDAIRNFDDGPLGVGQSLSFQMDVNFRDGFKGVNVRGADFSTTIFNFESSTNVDGGDTDGYKVNTAATGAGELFGNAYDADTVFTLIFTQTSLANGDWFITRSGGLSGSEFGTYAGQISGFQLFTSGAGSGDESHILFNNFSVVPEPSAYALLAGICALGYIMIRRRS